MQTAGVQSAEFTGAFRLVPAAVTIVTTRDQGLRFGMTATAVAPVSAEPPQILVAINKSARCGAAIVRSHVFAVNFLPADNSDLARLFSQQGLDPQSRFLPGEWVESITGSPLLRRALVSFDCEVVGCHQHGTHHVFIGRVASVARRDAAPLIYRDGSYACEQPPRQGKAAI